MATLPRDALLALVAAIVLVPGPIAAQRTPARELSAAFGVWEFDASGVDVAPIVALLAARELARPWLLAEARVAYSPLDEDIREEVTRFGVAELQLQAQLPSRRVRPYAGLGAGLAAYLSGASGRDSPSATLSAAAGVRLLLGRSVVLRGDLFVRGWDVTGWSGFASVGGGYTVGGGWRF